MRRYLFLLILGFNTFIYAQDTLEFTDLYGDYLGQKPPADTPQVFAPGIVSRNSLEHSAAIFTPDGNEVYWVSHESPSNGGKGNLWYMQRINNRWTKPVNLAPYGDSVAWMDPFPFNDGKRLYFSTDVSTLKKEGVERNSDKENMDLFYIDKQSKGWSKPQSLSQVVNTSNGQCQASYTSDGTVYYIDYKMIENKWTCDIMRARCENGLYHQPDTLPACINSQSEDWTPCIAPDESYLIFVSYRHKDRGGLFISFHDVSTDSWSDPINMGEPINTKSQEAYPALSPDGKYLFFTRWTNEESDNDVYWVSTKIIDKLRIEKNM